MNRGSERHNWLAPLLGGLTLLGTIALIRSPILAIALGTLVMAGSWFLLRPRDYLGESLRKNLSKVHAQALREQLTAVSDQIMHLEQLNRRIPDEVLTKSLNLITQRAAFLAQEVVRDPNAMNQTAKRPLLIYLPQVEALAERYASMQRFGSLGDDTMLKRTRQSMQDLVLLFDNHIEKLHKAEAMDLDVQISVIEQRLRSDGIVKVGQETETGTDTEARET